MDLSLSAISDASFATQNKCSIHLDQGPYQQNPTLCDTFVYLGDDNQEVALKDLAEGSRNAKAGYRKI